MFPFERFIAIAMLALLLAAALALFILGKGSSQLQAFANARSVCESSYAGSCYNTGKAPVTWDTPTQSLNGSALSCSRLLNCACAGGRYSCSVVPI